MISFNDIPNNLRVPLTYIEFDNTKAVTGTPGIQYKLLVIGKTYQSTGDRISSNWDEPVLFTRPDEADRRCGQGSQLALMLKAALGVNPGVEIWGLGVGGAEANMGTLSINGAATEAGTVALSVAGKRYAVAVAVGMDAEGVCNALETVLVGDSPVIGTASGEGTAAQLTLKAKYNDDTIHSTGFYVEEGVAGLALEYTLNPVAPNNPSIESIIDRLGDVWWNAMVLPWSDEDTLATLKTELLGRFGPLRMIDGLVFTAGLFATNDNSFLHTHLDISNAVAASFVVAATNAAVVAKSLSIDPARPLQTLALPGIRAKPPTYRDTKQERNVKLHNGVSTTFVDAGGNVCIERQITTYTQNALGAQDPSYLDVETLATLSYLRYSTRTRINLRFPRHKLADDGTLVAPGQAMVTPSIIKAELVALAGEWAEMGLIEDLAGFKDSLVVQRNASDRNRVDVLASPNLVNQLRIFAEQIQFIL